MGTVGEVCVFFNFARKTRTRRKYWELNNYIIGVIPPALGRISTLEIVDLSLNQLIGSIPNEVWKMPNIMNLNLGENVKGHVSLNSNGVVPSRLW